MSRRPTAPLRRKTLATLLAALALLAAACGDDGSADGDRSDESAASTTTEVDQPDGEGWTVLNYVVADNDLEPFALDDLEEMASVGGQDGLNMIALVDRSPDYSDDDAVGVPDFEGTKLFEMGDGTMEEVDDLGELNMGEPETLADFITRGIEDYPAARYSLVLWDHGASWPGMGVDETDGGELLDLADLESAIADGLEGAGVDKLDMLGFDACLMATYEVASVLAPYADTLVASAELEPGHGWDYAGFGAAADDPDISPIDLSKSVLQAYSAQAREEGTNADITLSVFDLTQMPALNEAVGDLSEALSDDIDAMAAEVGSQRERVVAYGRNPDPSLDTQMTDLGSLTAKLANTEGSDDVAEAADAVRDALDAVVVDHTAGPVMAQSTGMSIYFPPTADLLDDAYLDLGLDSAWPDFLDSYYSAGQEIPEGQDALSAFLNVNHAADFGFDENGNLVFGGELDPEAEANLIEATLYYGLPQPDGTIVFFGEEPGVLGGDGTASGFFDMTALSITDGIDTSYAYSSITFQEGQDAFSIDVPLAYYPEGADPGGDDYQDVILSLVVSASDGSIQSEVYYTIDAETGAQGELSPDPQGLIFPLVLAQYPDGTSEWVPAAQVGLYAELANLQYSFDPVPSGTDLYVELDVFDFGGNSDYVFLETTVP